LSVLATEDKYIRGEFDPKAFAERDDDPVGNKEAA
jgi:hypothetical protein